MPFDAAGRGPVNPYDLGAVGTGTSTPVTAPQLAPGGWTFGGPTTLIGTYAVGDERDYIAWQEAAYWAFGQGTTTPNGSASVIRNREIHCDGGHFRLNKPLSLVKVLSFVIEGAGKLVTRLVAYGGQPAILINRWSYGEVNNLLVGTASVCDCLIDADSDGIDGTNLGVSNQAVTFRSVFFDGSGMAQDGIAVGRTGSQSQGSEYLYIACHWQSCLRSGMHTGNYNALQHTILGGNIQDCPRGLWVQYGGYVVAVGVGFQNGTGKQYRASGADLLVENAAGDCNVLLGCRSESAFLAQTFNGGHTYIVACSSVSPVPVLTAGQTVHPGDLVSVNGRAWVVVSVNGSTDPANTGIVGTVPTSSMIVDASIVWNYGVTDAAGPVVLAPLYRACVTMDAGCVDGLQVQNGVPAVDDRSTAAIPAFYRNVVTTIPQDQLPAYFNSPARTRDAGPSIAKRAFTGPGTSYLRLPSIRQAAVTAGAGGTTTTVVLASPRDEPVEIVRVAGAGVIQAEFPEGTPVGNPVGTSAVYRPVGTTSWTREDDAVTASQLAAAVRANLATELARIDVAVSTVSVATPTVDPAAVVAAVQAGVERAGGPLRLIAAATAGSTTLPGDGTTVAHDVISSDPVIVGLVNTDGSRSRTYPAPPAGWTWPDGTNVTWPGGTLVSWG